MAAYYNENDENAVAWLRELIKRGHIADGIVDDRSISDVQPEDLKDFIQCHFFAGIGGWSLALRLAGWRDDSAVWTGSCPCQPFSAAGKRKGFADNRHLWPVWKRLIEKRRPAVVFGEQVASAAQWLRLVRSDLEALDYAVGAIPVQAASAGADHLRDRFWIVADRASEQVGSAGQSRECGDVANSDILERRFGNQQSTGEFPQQRQHWETCDSGDVGDASGTGTRRHSSSSVGPQDRGQQERPLHGGLSVTTKLAGSTEYGWAIGADGKARRVKPGIRLLVNGFPARVGLLRGFGNAIDPRPASAFIKAYMQCRFDRLNVAN